MADVLERLNAALADRYRLERELGQGGMATVYLAQDLRHHRPVALKVLRPDLAATLGSERFLREIEIAAQLHHPHILPLYDSGDAGGFLFYVMPYEEGRSLREKLEREGELPVGDVVRLLRDVLDALAHAHAHGVVHRDIKPENILLSGQHALVTDFGVAKAVSEASGRQQLTTRGVALGTPAYMAPEQAAADPHVDQRADIYAAGIVAYELLTGRPPFERATAQQVLAAQVTDTPEPVTSKRPAVSPALAQLVMRCLEKKPADRPQSAAELLPQLEALLTPSGGMTPVGTQPVAAVPSRRSRRTALIGGAAVVALAAVAAGSIWLGRTRPNVIPSATRIAVLPLSPVVPDTALTRMGRELVVLLSANLDGVGDMSTVDAAALLAKVGQDAAPIPLDRGAALGQSFGAASVLTGTLVRAGDGVRVEASLVETDGLEPVARVSVASSRADVGALADSLTWALLEQIWRGRQAPTPFLVARMTSSFGALRAFLEGEKDFMEGRYPAAAAAYGRAITEDSTFWLAYWRLARANSWVMRPTPEAIVETYWEHRAELPERDRLLVEAGHLGSRSQASAARLEVTRRYPDYTPAWWDYADQLVHYGGFFGHPLEEAVAGLEHVAELSPASVSVWDHLGFSALWLGDSAGMARALDALDRLGARALIREGYGWDMVGLLRLSHQLRFEGAAITPAVVDTALRIASDVDAVMPMIVRLRGLYFIWASPALQLEVNRLLLRRDLPREQAMWVRWANALVWAMRGAWDSAFVAFDRHLAADAPDGARLEAYRLAGLSAWLGAVEPERAQVRRAGAERDASAPADLAELAWIDGLLGVARRDAAALRVARGRLAGSTAPSAVHLDRSLAAFETELGGNRGGAAEQLLALVNATGDSTLARRYPAFDAVTRLAVSRWLLEQGDADRALPPLYWAEAWHTGSSAAVTQAVSGIAALQRARVEAALGRGADAARYYRNFLRIYDMPGPRHRQLVAEAEAALARLSDAAGRGP